MKYSNALFLFVFMLLMLQSVSAQERTPVRAYIAPEELISMDAETTFPQAMDVFNNASKRFRYKPIIYDGSEKNKIGLQITHMHWQDAFELVLRLNEHWYSETDDYVTVFKMNKSKDTSAMKAAAAMVTREVQISAIFFETNRTELEKLGIDWLLTNQTPTTSTSFLMSNSGLKSAITEGGKQVIGGSTDDASSSQQNQGIELGSLSAINLTGGATELLALLKVFESENLGDLISSPNITVRSGEEGRIQVGQDFSVKQQDFSGNTIDRFYSAGTIIQVVPTVMRKDSIEFVHLEITAERSSVVPDPVSTVINKTQASTQVILLDGEETVVGGLMSHEVVSVHRGVPILKDLPWWFFGLRYLFGYEEEQVVKKELIIILKATIVPSIENRVAKKLAEIQQNNQETLYKETLRFEAHRRSLVRQIRAARSEYEEQDSE